MEDQQTVPGPSNGWQECHCKEIVNGHESLRCETAQQGNCELCAFRRLKLPMNRMMVVTNRALRRRRLRF